MKAGAIACVALTLALSFAQQGWANDTEYPIAIEAAGIERSDHRIYLDMRVWNCSNKPLTMERSNLPWGVSLGRGLVIYEAYTGKALEQETPIEDFPYRSYTIPSGGSIAGKIDLYWYFPKLAEAKDMRDLVVFWVYQPLGREGVPVGRKFGGMVPLDSGLFRTSRENPCRLRAIH